MSAGSKESPRVTIGMPVHNGELYLAEALRSILTQEFTDFELVISDNASTDATEAICREFAARDRRIRFDRLAENLGAAYNYNSVFAKARGEFFKWAAHDDLCHPAMLRRCVETYDAANQDVVLVYTRAHLVDSSGAVLEPDPIRLETRGRTAHERLASTLRRMTMATPLCGLIRASALEKTRLIGGYPSSDKVLLAELSMLGEIHEVPEFLFSRRIHGGASRRANRTQDEVARWFDPRKRGRGLITEWQRLVLEYFRAPLRLRLGFLERCACFAAVVRHVVWKKVRVVGGRYKSRILSAVRGGNSKEGTS